MAHISPTVCRDWGKKTLPYPEEELRQLYDTACLIVSFKLNSLTTSTPLITQAMRFNLPPVNAPSWTLCGICLGAVPAWFPDIDPRASRYLIDSILKETPSITGSLFATLDTPMKRMNAVGAQQYFSKVKKEGKDIHLLAIAVPKSDMGDQAASELFAAATDPETHEAIPYYLFGGMKILLSPFPPEEANSRRKERERFIERMVTKTHTLARSTFVHRLPHLNKAILTDELLNTTTTNTIDMLIGMIPTFRNGRFDPGAILVFHKKSQVICNTPSHYANIFATEIPALIPDDTDVNSEWTPLVDIAVNGTPRQPTHAQQERQITHNATDQDDLLADHEGRPCAVVTGAGGRASAGVWPWFGKTGAKARTNGIPESLCRSYDTIEQCWEHLNKYYSDVYDEDSLRLFLMQVPLSETNLTNPNSLIHIARHNNHKKREATWFKDNDMQLYNARARVTKGHSLFSPPKATPTPTLTQASTIGTANKDCNDDTSLSPSEDTDTPPMSEPLIKAPLHSLDPTGKRKRTATPVSPTYGATIQVAAFCTEHDISNRLSHIGFTAEDNLRICLCSTDIWEHAAIIYYTHPETTELLTSTLCDEILFGIFTGCQILTKEDLPQVATKAACAKNETMAAHPLILYLKQQCPPLRHDDLARYITQAPSAEEVANLYYNPTLGSKTPTL